MKQTGAEALQCETANACVTDALFPALRPRLSVSFSVLPLPLPFPRRVRITDT